jgi:acyl-CoA synthetase (AMP-forming)/AMP-acid ligase II
MSAHPSFASRDLSSVRGGTLLEALPEAHRPPSPDRAPMPLGMTETGGPHTSADDAYLPVPEHLRGTFGRSLPGVEHHVVTERDTDSVGELLVRGPLVMDSIYKAERHETFTADGWYPTGDLGDFDADGYLRFHGRRNAMIKSGGSNISPAEVEAELIALEDVDAAYVLGVPGGDRGEDVAAVVVAPAGSKLDIDSLCASARVSLSGYKVPRRWRIVTSVELPMLPTGKVDRSALRSWFEVDSN